MSNVVNVRFAPAGSSDRCNTSIKSFGWGFEAQSLTRPFIELPSHAVELRLRVHPTGRCAPRPSRREYRLTHLLIPPRRRTKSIMDSSDSLNTFANQPSRLRRLCVGANRVYRWPRVFAVALALYLFANFARKSSKQ